MKIVSNSDSISSSDRAFNYGDGIFTTLCVSNRNIELLSFHLKRLTHDAAVLGIQLDETILSHAIYDYVNSLPAELDKKVVKIHVSAGEGGRGYARHPQTPALVRFSTHAYPQHYSQLKQTGMEVICARTKLAIQPLLGGVKHLNRLEQVLIKQEVTEAKVDDALVFNTNDELVEASAGNVFFKIADRWHTPEITHCGVNGVVRQCLINEMTRAGIDVHQGKYTFEDIMASDSLLVTNALMGVMPVAKLSLSDLNESKLFSQSIHSSAVLASLLTNKIQDEYANTP